MVTEMISRRLALLPCKGGSGDYQIQIKSILEEKYRVVDYFDILSGYYDLMSIDVIYLNWIEDGLDDYQKKLIIKARLLGKKVIWTFHNKVSHESKSVEKNIDNIRFLAKYSNKIIILSKKSINVIKQYCPKLNLKKLHYVPHPNFIGEYGNIYKSDSVESNGFKKGNFSIGNDDFVFGCFGNIRPYKNIEMAISAFSELKLPNSKLIIIGDALGNNEYLDTLSQNIQKKDSVLIWDKSIYDFEMDYYMGLTDAVILPYKYRSSMNSGVMIAAFSCRRTTISSSIEMVDEFPRENMYTYDYKTDEEHLAALKESMLCAYNDGKKACHQKGLQMYEYVKNNNSKAKVRERLFSIL